MQVNGRGALSGGTQAFAGNIGDHSQQRTFRFESMQAELVQAVEVYKSAQANLMEGGMGGTLNIRTRRPFDNGGQRIIAGNAFMTDDALADENGYRFAGVYSDAFADNTLGFLVSVAGDDRTTREDWFNIVDYRTQIFNRAINLATGEPLKGCSLPGIANPDRGCGYVPGNIRQGVVLEDVERINASAALQWRPNEQWDVTVDVLHSQMDRDMDDFQVPWRSQAGLGNGASEVLLNENQIVTYMRTETARPRPFQRPRVEDIESQQFAVNAQYTPTEKWTLSFDVSHTTGDRTRFHRDNYYDIPAVPLTYDIRDSYVPKITIEENLLDPNVYQFIIFGEGTNIAEDTETQYRFDATYHFDDGTAFHAGLSFRDRERFWERRSLSFGPRWGDFAGERLTDVNHYPLPVDDAFSGISGTGTWPKSWLLPDHHDVRATYLVGRRDEIPAARFTAAATAHEEDFTITEDTLALYFMVEMSGTIGDFPWSGNVGARWIQVDRDSTGNVQPVEQMVFLEAAGIWEMDLGPAEFQTHGNRFAEVLPALNLKFELREDLIARFAWGKVMTQPAFADLNPGGTKHSGTRRVQEGDPNLEPYVAEQLDIGLEWYPTDDAIIAAAGVRQAGGVVHRPDHRATGLVRARRQHPVRPGIRRQPLPAVPGSEQRGRRLHRRHRVRGAVRLHATALAVRRFRRDLQPHLGRHRRRVHQPEQRGRVRRARAVAQHHQRGDLLREVQGQRPRRVEQAGELPDGDLEPPGQPAVHERLLATRRGLRLPGD